MATRVLGKQQLDVSYRCLGRGGQHWQLPCGRNKPSSKLLDGFVPFNDRQQACSKLLV
jgi:hypothetical protein